MPEHDIRGAIGRPGDRTGDLGDVAADRLLDGLELPATLAFDLGDRVVTPAPVDGPMHHVRTTAFEVFRVRLGRRSPEQVLTLERDAPPPIDVVDELFIVGPRPTPPVE